jgi:hypothetical protein
LSTGVAIHDWDGRAQSLAVRVATESKFDRIYLTVEDRHVLWRANNVLEAVDAFKQQGLEVYLDPWGVAGKFAGEAIGEPGHELEWAELAAESAADGILIDEPKGEEWEDTVEEWIGTIRALAPEKRIILGLQPERILSKWYDYEDYVEELAISTYFFPPRIERTSTLNVARKMNEWNYLMPVGASVWVQTWGIPAGQEWLAGFMIKQWRSLGRDVNVWSWDASQTTSKIAPAHPTQVWNNVLNAIGKDN